jgi:hypothetical protein
MDNNERELISGLFERMRAQGYIEKDQDAAALIDRGVRQNPDAPYMLVQSVLVQELALQQADQRIRDLERQVQEAQSGRGAHSGGGFLGGLFGGGRSSAPPSRGSVPSYGSSSYRGARGGGPFDGSPGGRPMPMGQPAAAGGGFMRQAMATAAGVAGGMLLANSIGDLLGGDAAQAKETADSGNADQQSGADNNQQAEYQDPNDNDPGVQDASYDDGGDFGGGMDI